MTARVELTVTFEALAAGHSKVVAVLSSGTRHTYVLASQCRIEMTDKASEAVTGV
jgi:hypothetical protein